MKFSIRNRVLLNKYIDTDFNVLYYVSVNSIMERNYYLNKHFHASFPVVIEFVYTQYFCKLFY